ncbi:Myosin-like coiled-coil protein [Rhizoctonia solani]|uniref:Myosin-like coiled-coil protein n=1 Tax=Rhizoctonia solani TaxID=456999 RepID=A0A8H7M431_9AGAM|nr:Myosin-like coiled-coil protein [Rhizoctonia solani]
MASPATTHPPSAKPPPTGPPPRPTPNANGNGTRPPHSARIPMRNNQMIAVLEEEEVTVEEEERRLAEEARRTVKGMSDSAVQTKYIELFQEMKRLEREHAKEKQKLTRDKDTAKMQYNKASQARTKLENLARELQKDNKKLRVRLEDTRRLTISFEEARDEINQVKDELVQRQMAHPRRVQVREELFFKINRKTKLTRLFSTWESRMDTGSSDKKSGKTHFIFTHAGRAIDWDIPEDDAEATRAVEEMLDVVVRERLKDVLRQYERRERHFEAVVRSKELEVLLARARVEEQKGCAEVARRVARASEQQNAALQTELEELQRQEAATATKLQQCLHTLGKNSSADPAPAAARIVRDVLWEHLDLRAQAIEHDTNNHASGEDS